MRSFITIAFCIISVIIQAHPLKMAYTSITYNTQKKVFEISHRLFQDDFEKVLSEYYNYDKDIYLNKANTNAQLAIAKFLEKNFFFKINNQKIKSKYLNIEQKNQMGIIIILESDIISIENLKSITIYNSLMMEGFKEQVNMLRINIADTLLRTLKYQSNKKEHTIVI